MSSGLSARVCSPSSGTCNVQLSRLAAVSEGLAQATTTGVNCKNAGYPTTQVEMLAVNESAIRACMKAAVYLLLEWTGGALFDCNIVGRNSHLLAEFGAKHHGRQLLVFWDSDVCWVVEQDAQLVWRHPVDLQGIVAISSNCI